MQLIVFLSMISLAYVSCENVQCQLDFSKNADNQYIKSVHDDDWSIKEVTVLSEITQDAELMIKYKMKDEDEAVLKEGEVPLCHDNPNEAERLVIHLLGKGLGLWKTIPCPVLEQTVNKPPRTFSEDYSFGETTDPGMFVDISLLDDKKSILNLYFTVLRENAETDDE